MDRSVLDGGLLRLAGGRQHQRGGTQREVVRVGRLAVGTRLRSTPGALATLAPGPAADPAAFLATVDADASAAE